MTCNEVVEYYYTTGRVTRHEMFNRIVESYNKNTNIQEMVDKFKPEEAEFFKREIERAPLEGGFQVFGGAIKFERIPEGWQKVPYESPVHQNWCVEALKAFKQFYGFQISKE